MISLQSMNSKTTFVTVNQINPLKKMLLDFYSKTTFVTVNLLEKYHINFYIIYSKTTFVTVNLWPRIWTWN